MNTVFALKHEDDVLDIATKTGFKTIDGKEVQLTSTLAAQMMRMAKQKAREEKDDEALLQSPTMWSCLMGFQNKEDAVLIRTASTLLYLAGLQNKADVARQVFASYPEYFSKTNDKYGVLIESAYNGSSEVISECLAHGADLNPKYGTTPLDAAAEVGNEAMVKYFLSKGAVVSSGRNSEIITAAKYDHPNILDALLLRSKKDTTALWEAFAYGAQNGNKKTLEKLFKETDKMGISLIHSFTPPKKTWSEVYATGVLSNAVKAGHMDVIQMLINKGAKLEQKYTPNESLLVTAINHQKTDVVDLLLDNGANIQKFGVATIFNVLKRKDEKVMLNPVLMAAYNMDIPMIQHLVKKGADINSLTQNTGTVLDFYQKMGHFHLSEIDSSDQKGALLMAKYQKNFERGIEILRGLGAKTCAEMNPIKNYFNKFAMDRFKKTDKS